MKRGSAPRILLVTGVAPGDGCVGEIILRDLCRLYRWGSIACFALPGSSLTPRLATGQEGMPMQCVTRPRERPRRWPTGRFGAFVALADSQWRLRRRVGGLVAEAARFGQSQAVEKVWMVLDAPTILAMGPRVAERLGVPLISLVWDPPGYLLRMAGMDRLTRALICREFGRTLRMSERVAVVSQRMAEDYGRRCSGGCVILRHGLSPEDHRRAATHLTNGTRLVIGFAGGLYAQSAWNALMGALKSVGWRVAGRDVVVRMLGSSFDFRASSMVRVEYLGWRSLTETAKILGGCDVNYLPQPFEPSLRELAQYSFPTKLSTYLAAGRPVFVHAPADASLSRFFRQHPIGVCCRSLEPDVVAADLARLGSDADLYARAAQEAWRVAKTEFSQEQFRRRFAEFLGVEESGLCPPRMVVSGSR